jgi:superfamily II DNA or RNA helicase
MLSGLTFKYEPRKAQKQVLDLIFGSKKDQRKHYIVCPPGAGKTILGLLTAIRFNIPSLVLVPNTAIQSQWVQKTVLFESETPRTIASSDPYGEEPIIVMTYQALARPGKMSDDERQRLITEWLADLVEDGEDEASAAAWLKTYQENNSEKFEASLLRKWKKIRGTDEEGQGLLSEDAWGTFHQLKKRNVGLVIFDECHHLVGYWGQVSQLLVDHLGARTLGLTATPPNSDHHSPKELELHTALLSEIDFYLPTPAVVRDGNLAPFQDLVYFTRPLEEELNFIKECSNQLGEVLGRCEEHEGTRLSTWLLQELENLDKAPAKTKRLRHAFISSAVKYVKAHNLNPPTSFASGEAGELPLDELAALIDKYSTKCLLVSDDLRNREFYSQLTQALRPMGYMLTERGMRKCQSTVNRILALSTAKTHALIDILKAELNSGYAIRALVVTDFEKSTATIHKDIENLLSSESGGAIAALRAIVSDPQTDCLDPILVTGQTVLVDDDLLPRFLAEAEKWIEEKQLKITLESLPDDGFFHIKGQGSDWSTRNYVQMITHFFEMGVTKCLVGTRGLLGEGWDALCVNTLVDLTSATTEMTVNQLRGRSIRVDPKNPEKVANNWDVVCLAPEYEKGFDDYKRFGRKHKNYYGICDDGTIEYGLGHIHPALTEKKPERVALSMHIFNAEMTERCAQRSKIREAWRIGEPYQDIEMPSLEIQEPGLGEFPIDPLTMEGVQRSKCQYLEAMSRAVFHGLADLKLIEGEKAQLHVSERADDYYRIFLQSSSTEDMTLFTTSISELFEPIDKQRYIIPRHEEARVDTWYSKFMPSVIGRYFQKKKNIIAIYHPLPTVFGTSKEKTETFNKYWNHYVSPGEAIYTKRGKGEKTLLEAREKNQTNQNARQSFKQLWF